MVTLTTPPIIGLMGTLLRRFKGSKTYLLEHGPAPRRQRGAGADVEREPGRASARVARATCVYRQADKLVVLGPYMADRVAAKGVGPTGSRRSPSGAVATRSIRVPREGHPLRQQLGLDEQVRGDVLGQPGPGPYVRRVPRGGPPPQRSGDIVFVFVGDGPRMAEVQGACRREGSTTSASSITCRATSSMLRSRWPTCT